MADENEGQDKTEEPTQHRIDEFRKKGQVAVSRELSSVLNLICFNCNIRNISIIYLRRARWFY